MKEKLSESWENLSSSEREERGKLISSGMNARSEADKEKWRDAISVGLVDYYDILHSPGNEARYEAYLRKLLARGTKTGCSRNKRNIAYN